MPRSVEKTPDDEWMEYCDREVALAMAQWLRETINIRRPINTLTRAEMQTLASVAQSTWIVLQTKRAELQRPYDPAKIGTT